MQAMMAIDKVSMNVGIILEVMLHSKSKVSNPVFVQ